MRNHLLPDTKRPGTAVKGTSGPETKEPGKGQAKNI